MGEYTLLALVAPLVAVGLELFVFRTGLLRKVQFWISVAILWSFQVPVDGWLTKPEGTVVHYDEAFTSGIRFPWHIPVEDFGFGFAMITLTLSLWLWWQRRDQRAGSDRGRPATASADRGAHHA